jgi:hypothetical protein
MKAAPPWRKPLVVVLAGVSVGACNPMPDDTKTVSLPALSFLPTLTTAAAGADAHAEQVIGRSVWAVAPVLDPSSEKPGRVVGSAVAVSGATLLADCDVAGTGGMTMIARRSTRRPAKAVARGSSGGLCELRPADVRLRMASGYRPFHSVEVGEPVLAVVSRSSRSFDLVRGSITGKGSADDPFLETSVILPAGTRSAAMFDRAGNLMGFGSAGLVGDAVVVAVPIVPEAAPWLAQVKPQAKPVVTKDDAGEQS